MQIKFLAFAAGAVVLAGAALAGSHSVGSYIKKDGTYVAPHEATNPNSTKTDNWSTKGNTNPYTGQQGTVDPYRVAPTPAYPAASAAWPR